jgi:hypothetical protein
MEYLGYGLARNAGWHVHAKLCHELAALRAHPAFHMEGKAHLAATSPGTHGRSDSARTAVGKLRSFA